MSLRPRGVPRMGRRRVTLAILTLMVAATVAVARATPPHGFIEATIFARGAVTTPVHAHADGVVLNAQPPIDHVVQRVVWGPGASSGWHRHPGVVLVTVQSGAVAFYEADCTARTFTAGQTFYETGASAGLVRNETGGDAIVYATYVVPAGAPLRIDLPNPGCSVD